MKTALFILATLLPCSLALAQGDPRDEAIFGDAEEVVETPVDGPALPEGIAPDENSREDALFGALKRGEYQLSTDEQALLRKDPLEIGGMVYMRYNAQVHEGEPEWPRTQSPNLVDVYMDARHDKRRLRAYVRGRLKYDPLFNPDADFAWGQASKEEVEMVLDQLWVKFDVERSVFFTVGAQPVRWGATRIWNPVDVVNPTRRDPLAAFDDRTGLPMIKLHVPIESLGWNFILLGMMDRADTMDKVGAAARAEFVFSTVELGVSGVLRRYTDPKAGIDLSAGVGDFDINGEFGVRFTDEPGHKSLFSAGDRDAVMQAAAGISYDWKYSAEDTVTVAGEYFYNPDGVSGYCDYPLMMSGMFLEEMFADATPADFNIDPANLPPGFDPSQLESKFSTPGEFRPFYNGRHYGAVAFFLPAPGSWDRVTFFLSNLGNFSDMSFISRFDYRHALESYLSIEAFVAVHYGQRGGEFKFGTDRPIGDYLPADARTLIELLAPEIMDALPPDPVPYPAVDLGIAIRVLI